MHQFRTDPANNSNQFRFAGQSSNIGPIRPLLRTDARWVVEGQLSLFDEGSYFWDLLRRGKPKTEEVFEEVSKLCDKISGGTAVGSVATVDGRLVGMCKVFGLSNGLDFNGMLGVWVLKEHRRNGWGSQLLKDALYRSNGMFDNVKLWVSQSNVEAIRLYKRFGFEIEETMPWPDTSGESFNIEIMNRKMPARSRCYSALK